ncbi:MAG: crossover junction endodeoxyribonuclease RuvC [Bacteroidales bacterium]
MQPGERIILGIDPGTTILGYGIVRAERKDPVLITLGVVDLRKEEDHFAKLSIIFERTLELIREYKPAELAVEAPFFGKNVQSMLKLGRAQGAAIAAAMHLGLPVFEYAPRKIKMAITGMGNASKEQVAAILQRTLNIMEMPKNLDATDGLAAAVCHFYQKQPGTTGKSYSSWKDFIAQNPGKKR